MTVLVVVDAPVSSGDFVSDYVAFVAELELGASTHEMRNRCARELLAARSDLDDWIVPPIAAWLTDLSRVKPGPLFVGPS